VFGATGGSRVRCADRIHASWRRSHHPLGAVLAGHFLLHGWPCGAGTVARPVAWWNFQGGLAPVAEKHPFGWCARRRSFLTSNYGFSRAAWVVLHHRATADALAEGASRPRHRVRALDEHYAQVSFFCNSSDGTAPRRFVDDPRAAASDGPRWKKATRCSRLHLPRLGQQSRAPRQKLCETTTIERTWKIASPN